MCWSALYNALSSLLPSYLWKSHRLCKIHMYYLYTLQTAHTIYRQLNFVLGQLLWKTSSLNKTCLIFCCKSHRSQSIALQHLTFALLSSSFCLSSKYAERWIAGEKICSWIVTNLPFSIELKIWGHWDRALSIKQLICFQCLTKNAMHLHQMSSPQIVDKTLCAPKIDMYFEYAIRGQVVEAKLPACMGR